MNLSPEQKQTLATWVAAGDNLSAIQKKLHDQFQVTLTYMDVRFLVDDLDLALKDPAPKADTSDVSQAPPPPHAPPTQATATDNGDTDAPYPEPDALPPAHDADATAPVPDAADAAAPTTANVTVNIDPVTLLPGALASGTVRFSDGVTGKWMVDNYGRPGFTEISQPGYQPSPADAQAFIQELSRHL